MSANKGMSLHLDGPAGASDAAGVRRVQRLSDAQLRRQVLGGPLDKCSARPAVSHLTHGWRRPAGTLRADYLCWGGAFLLRGGGRGRGGWQPRGRGPLLKTEVMRTAGRRGRGGGKALRVLTRQLSGLCRPRPCPHRPFPRAALLLPWLSCFFSRPIQAAWAATPGSPRPPWLWCLGQPSGFACVEALTCAGPKHPRAAWAGVGAWPGSQAAGTSGKILPQRARPCTGRPTTLPRPAQGGGAPRGQGVQSHPFLSRDHPALGLRSELGGRGFCPTCPTGMSGSRVTHRAACDPSLGPAWLCPSSQAASG